MSLVTAQKERAVELAKTLHEETKRIREEEAIKRSELQERMQSALQNVTSHIDTFSEQQKALADENKSLRDKIEGLLHTISLMTTQHETAIKAKDLERQLAEAKLAQAEVVSSQKDAMARASMLRFHVRTQPCTPLPPRARSLTHCMCVCTCTHARRLQSF
ncbi:hypothetical protein EON67_00240 [archaeon]|nr:MAG: hypothetical protein EON67_00240 [archaeon]